MYTADVSEQVIPKLWQL